LPINLLRAREAVMQNFRTLLNQFGVTEQQWRVVRVLAERDRIDASAIARASCILPASLSRILRDLERRKLLSTRHPTHDSRRVIAKLTPRGEKLYRAIAVRSELIYQYIERAVGIRAVAALSAALRRLTLRLELLDPPAARSPKGRSRQHKS
jgi:homoprotocatechuate degradation regulator HpaR